MRTSTAFYSCAATFMSVVPFAAFSAAETVASSAQYTMDIKLYDGDQLVASPQLQFTAGEVAQIKSGDTASFLYALTVTATPQGSEQVAIEWNIDLESAGIRQKCGIRQTLAPKMVAAKNSISTIEFGVESETCNPFRIEFTISE